MSCLLTDVSSTVQLMRTSSFSSGGVPTLLYASAVAPKGVFTGLSVGYPGPQYEICL
jgi:hypothetical protein